MIWGANAKDKADPIRIEKAFPAIISKAKSQRVNRLMRSRAPKIAHPRRVGSTYLLSGLVKCHKCNRALSGQDAKSGQFSYYVCQSIMKRGKGTCKTPRLNAKSFEKLIVNEIRANILTESNIRDLVKLLDEEMDGVARDQRQRLETIEEELEDVKKRLGRIWNHIETTDTEMADASDRIREHRERKEKLEIVTEEARALLKERRQFLDSADTIAAFAAEMSDFLKTSELTETKAFVGSFVKEVVVKPGRAAIVYSIPISQSTQKTDLLLGGRSGEFWVDNADGASSQSIWNVEGRMQGHEVIATKSHGTPGRWAYRQMMGRLPMGSMAPTDCATPALVGGSSLLRWAFFHRRQNRL